MSPWPQYPTIYEINTWVWLNELARRNGRAVHLGTVPSQVWDAIAALGFHAVWLMGIWERSPTGIAIANRNESLLADFHRALPDFQNDDNVGSPYCVHRYEVDAHLGGRQGLALARQSLAQRGIRLLLDFVPNHVAPDHPWVSTHPEFFLRGSKAEARNNPGAFIKMENGVFACGKDPYFPAWPDVLQLNAFQPGLRKAVITTLSDIASQCDGVRCDMAMLLLNSVFERTWGARAGAKPATEYWHDIIPAIKRSYPEFRFIAEAYWDLEWELQQQGFDFCYDKRLYDRLEHENAENVRLHLCAEPVYQDKLLRFLENHDEPRAASAFSPDRERAAAVVTSTLTGSRLFHDGQFEGRRVRLPVFLGRRPDEPLDAELREFYEKLLEAINRPVFSDGDWRLCECTGWADNQSCRQLLAWQWQDPHQSYLIIVNFSDSPAQGMVHTGFQQTGGSTLTLIDQLSGAVYSRSADELSGAGLYVDLPPWGRHFLHCQQDVASL